MYGHGHAQPVPPQRGVPASVIVLRVLFAVLPLLSIGFLAWATALRIALLTRRVVDWILLGVSVVVVIAGIVLMPEDVNTSRADWVVGMILLNAVAFTAYFLVVDIRHDHLAGRAAVLPPPYNPYAATVPQHRQPQPQPQQLPYHQQQPSYGYPQPQPQTQPQPQPQPQSSHPQPVAPPTPPVASPRIDQVRAELDELSDLLRKDKDPREGGR
ncbi:hypothetical protein [Streptomyces sp. NBC_01268]|uniref:hypothetical protein n=1 Tax=unclassified Streptomyces TaxID=2593676 RepID=UPI002E36E151|nr:hypothetical protein [Streptomyces sp. NBC_01268]